VAQVYGTSRGSTNDVQAENLHPQEDLKPFHFNISAHLLRIGRERATNLSGLILGLRTCSENSIFEHIFRTSQEHYFIREGFFNDFAHRAFSACKEPGWPNAWPAWMCASLLL